MSRHLRIDTIEARHIERERDRYAVTIRLECDSESLARIRQLLESHSVDGHAPTTRALPPGPIDAEFIDEDGGPR